MATTDTDDASDVKLGPARDFERERVLRLWEEEFGFFGHEEDLLEKAMDHDQNGIWCLTIGSRTYLHAFSVVTRFSIEDFGDAYPGVDTSAWPKATNNGNTYMVAVDDVAKNQGYATMLVRRGHRWFLRNEVKRVWATSWHREGHVDSRRLFTSLGYENVGEQEAHYQNEVDDHVRDCPDCGEGCTCTASFWTKAITEADADDY